MLGLPENLMPSEKHSSTLDAVRKPSSLLFPDREDSNENDQILGHEVLLYDLRLVSTGSALIWGH